MDFGDGEREYVGDVEGDEAAGDDDDEPMGFWDYGDGEEDDAAEGDDVAVVPASLDEARKRGFAFDFEALLRVSEGEADEEYDPTRPELVPAPFFPPPPQPSPPKKQRKAAEVVTTACTLHGRPLPRSVLAGLDAAQMHQPYPTEWKFACMHCCHPFAPKPPVGMPVRALNGLPRKYVVRGFYCSFACVMGAAREAGTGCWIRTHICEMAREVYGMAWKERIPTAPPRERLALFGGDLDIDAFRAMSSEATVERLAASNIVYDPGLLVEIRKKATRSEDAKVSSENRQRVADQKRNTDRVTTTEATDAPRARPPAKKGPAQWESMFRKVHKHRPPKAMRDQASEEAAAAAGKSSSPAERSKKKSATVRFRDIRDLMGITTSQQAPS